MAKRPCCRLYRRALKVAIRLVFPIFSPDAAAGCGALWCLTKRADPKARPGNPSKLDRRQKVNRATSCIARELLGKNPTSGVPWLYAPKLELLGTRKLRLMEAVPYGVTSLSHPPTNCAESQRLNAGA